MPLFLNEFCNSPNSLIIFLVIGLIFPMGTQEVSEGDTVSVCVTPNITTDVSFTVPVNVTGITATCTYLISLHIFLK